MKKYSVLPGFAPSLGLTLLYLSLIVLIPLGALVWKTTDLGWAEFLAHAFSPRALAAYRVSFGCAFAAALINAPFGLLLAWVLVRYTFPGKRLFDALIDLPFALPTSVAGLTLTTLYTPNGWIGSWLAPLGIQVAYTPLGITLAMVFIGVPFVVRNIQPVLEELDPDLEEAAATLGANRWTTVWRVVLPLLWPSMLTGFSLAFARAVGEFGSVVFIAGNRPYQTEIAPLLIFTQLEQFQYASATAIGVVMLLFSFLSLLVVNGLQWYTKRKYGSH